jgi:hypothetical protein
MFLSYSRGVAARVEWPSKRPKEFTGLRSRDYRSRWIAAILSDLVATNRGDSQRSSFIVLFSIGLKVLYKTSTSAFR